MDPDPREKYSNLNCPNCKESCKDAVECSNCTSIFCLLCVVKLKCPVCQKNNSFKASYFARKFIAELNTNCPDCNCTVTRRELETHRISCSKRVRKCNIIGCDFKGKKQDFKQHIL